MHIVLRKIWKKNKNFANIVFEINSDFDENIANSFDVKFAISFDIIKLNDANIEISFANFFW